MHQKKPIKFAILLVGLLLTLMGVSLYLVFQLPLLSPLTPHPGFQFLSSLTQSQKSHKVVYGYLPYWNLSKVTLFPEVTHLSYFSLTIGPNGQIITQDEGGSEMGYLKLSDNQTLALFNQAEDQKTKIEITFAQFNDEDIRSFLNNKSAQDRFLDNVDALLLSYPVTGFNIDIEYAGEVNETLRNNLVSFVQRFRSHLKQKYQNINLSIAMYASSASQYQIYDVARINPEVDYIVMMAYDFHRRSSPQAGPIAPLFGGKKFWDDDVSEYLQAFLKIVDRQKLLLGIPFYGYEWQTTSRQAQAQTFPKTGATASFNRVQSILERKAELKVQEGWSEEALSPYLSYEQDNATYMIYYENSRSLSYKLDYVNQLNLGGIAIWALGYEGDSRELWDVIKNKI